MDYKRLPEEVSITPDNSAKVIGWTGKHSFVVANYEKVQSGAEVPNTFDLDGDEVQEDAEILSLWDWAKLKDLSIIELEELQNSLETYIDIEDV